MKKHTHKGFTLIELLMVIAIIGILAGILIPSVGAVKRQANVAASKAQISNYANGLVMYKGEYGYFPLANAGEIKLATQSGDFIEELSAKTSAGESSAGEGNRRRISFLSFSDSEYARNAEGTVMESQLADRFGNTNIVLVVDDDGDGIVIPKPSSTTLDVPGTGIRSTVTGYVDEDPADEDSTAYSLWN